MKKILLIVFAILITKVLLFAQLKSGSKKVNIVYIYADDLGWGELGAYGQKKIKTPNLDKMARDGMKFTQHYSGSPVCAPARCMLLTGKHGGHSYIRGNYEMGGFADSLEGGQMPLPEDIYTIPKMLKNAGYTSALVGKWGLGMGFTTGSPLKQGFDYYFGYLDQKQSHNFYPSHLWENDVWTPLNNPFIDVHRKLDSANTADADFEYYKGKEYACDKMTAKALSFLNSNKEKPFFLYLPYTIPHVSLQVPDEYIRQYIGQFNERPYYGQNGYASTKYPLSTYAAMITYLDEQVGIILKKIRDLGLENNTLLMFSSDNGTSFAGGVDAAFFNSVGGLRGLKMDLYEGGIRMPFIAKWPGKIKPGTTSDLISAQYDLMATLAELTGQDAGNTDGISFLQELLGNSENQKKHAYLYFEYPENGGQVAIRIGHWKAVRSNIRRLPAAAWELYDLVSDPFEQKDISVNHPEIVKTLNTIVQNEHQSAHIKEWEFLNPKFSVKSINE